MVIGKGTTLINCQFCGKEMLSGQFHKHHSSGECSRLSKEQHHKQSHLKTDKRLDDLEKDTETMEKINGVKRKGI